MVDAKPLPLNTMINLADRIFQGKVSEVSVRAEQLTEGGRSTTADVRTITITVSDWIKGPAADKTITVKQLARLSSPLAAGDEIFWFLPKPSQLGLTQPLGVYSGDFRVETKPDGTRVVQNLRGNEGLWADSVWDEGFDRQSVMLEAGRQKLTQARIFALEQSASSDPDSRELPLELLRLLTQTKANKPQ